MADRHGRISGNSFSVSSSIHLRTGSMSTPVFPLDWVDIPNFGTVAGRCCCSPIRCVSAAIRSPNSRFFRGNAAWRTTEVATFHRGRRSVPQLPAILGCIFCWLGAMTLPSAPQNRARARNRNRICGFQSPALPTRLHGLSPCPRLFDICSDSRLRLRYRLRARARARKGCQRSHLIRRTIAERNCPNQFKMHPQSSSQVRVA